VLMLVLGGLLIAISPFAPRTFTSNSDIARLSTIYLVLAGERAFLRASHNSLKLHKGAGNTLVLVDINTELLLVIRVFLACLFVGKSVL